MKKIANIKYLIAVASGKGGVGKSSLAVNLALALLQLGYKTGLLDADIYGPSQPWMLGKYETPLVNDQKQLKPIVSHGLPSMSIGYLLEGQETPMIWRGPMVSQALQQLIYNTDWPLLDYLIIDLPPGTGDIQLTLAQKIPVDGIVIITTPQEVAVLDARKALNMFKKMNIPILGVVENMAGHSCSICGHHDPIFGESGGLRLADQQQIPFLGAIPLDSKIRKHLDAGLPSLIAEPAGNISLLYLDLARKVVEAAQKVQATKEAEPRKLPIKLEP